MAEARKTLSVEYENGSTGEGVLREWEELSFSCSCGARLLFSRRERQWVGNDGTMDMVTGGFRIQCLQCCSSFWFGYASNYEVIHQI
jgi:hypothetical protein